MTGSVQPAANTGIEPLDGARWRAFVASSEAAVPFHHPAWAALMTEHYGYPGFAVVATGSGGRIVAGLPIMRTSRERWLALPFTDYCPPLAADEASLRELILGLNEIRKQNGIGELDVRSEIKGEHVYPTRVSLRHTLQLNPDPDAVFQTFRASRVRSAIKKAEREGVAVRRGESVDSVADVFYGLHLETRRRLGKPVQKRGFFELLWRRVLERGLGFVLVAYAGSVPAAGAVFLTWNGTTTYLYGASLREFSRLQPNQLLLWRAIERSCREGCHTFDFGRTDADNQGLRDFKRGWGTAEEPLVYSSIADSPPATANTRIRRAAETLIRHAPPQGSRMLGELLHRYTA